MAKEYVQKWTVPSSSNPDKSYTVSLTKEGNYECSCPTWIYRRQECHHIKQIKAAPASGESVEVKPLVVVPANVCEVTKQGNEVLAPLIPLCRAETTHFLATIVYDCYKLGVPFGALKEHFNIMPHDWTLEAVQNYIKTHGRMIQVKGDGIPIWDFITKTTYDGVTA